MPEVVWLQAARADLLAIVDYISDDSPDAAQRVKDDIEAKVGKLPEFPKMGRTGRVEGSRELVALSNYIDTTNLDYKFHKVWFHASMPLKNYYISSPQLLLCY